MGNARAIQKKIASLCIRMGAVVVLFCILGCLYRWWVRPAQLRWGATQDELSRSFPDDQLVHNPDFDATRAITIAATPEKVWPWIVQMGFGRAGYYGYDLIENLGAPTGIRSARSILAEFQDPKAGDVLPLSVAAQLQFGRVDAPRTLVWRGQDNPPSGVFIWVLEPVDPTHTRLISRIRWRYLKDPVGRALGVFTEFADHVAVRAILVGVRDRAEGRPPHSLGVEAAQIAAWLLVLGELCAGVVLVMAARHWRLAWLLSMGAGLLLLFCLYGPGPTWGNAALPWGYLALMVWSRRRAGSLLGRKDHAVVLVP